MKRFEMGHGALLASEGGGGGRGGFPGAASLTPRGRLASPDPQTHHTFAPDPGGRASCLPPTPSRATASLVNAAALCPPNHAEASGGDTDRPQAGKNDRRRRVTPPAPAPSHDLSSAVCAPAGRNSGLHPTTSCRNRSPPLPTPPHDPSPTQLPTSSPSEPPPLATAPPGAGSDPSGSGAGGGGGAGGSSGSGSSSRAHESGGGGGAAGVGESCRAESPDGDKLHVGQEAWGRGGAAPTAQATRLPPQRLASVSPACAHSSSRHVQQTFGALVDRLQVHYDQPLDVQMKNFDAA
ncbi:MAG: hypothetical protein WDW38_000449 [Sanguina aurantia]